MVSVTRTKSATYLFMEYCSEGDLKKFIPNFNNSMVYRQQGGKSILNERDARYVVKQVVDGLKYLRSELIIHRDIKLENILVHRRDGTEGSKIEDFEFKIGDMGLAKLMKTADSLNDTFAGTPLAMAPELIDGTAYNFKADVWSLGTLTFKMLTGDHPFTGTNLEHLKKNLNNGAYRIPKDLKLSVQCLDFLVSCLRFDSVKRKDWEQLLHHPFLVCDPLSQRLPTILPNESLILNTKQSMDILAEINKQVIGRIESRLKPANGGLNP